MFGYHHMLFFEERKIFVRCRDFITNSEKSGPVFRLSWEAHEQRRVKFVIDRHNKGHTTHKLSRNIKSILHKQKKF